ncbi:MAG TPA: nitrile hydratase accessory protein [Acidimicrobiales bacterium]
MTVTVGVLDVYGPASPPRSNGELVFSEPWESRAFGLALALHAGGAFDWEDFRQELIATIAVAEGPWSYYRCWLVALESVLAASGLVSPAEVDHRALALATRPTGHDHEGHDHG